jgi:hypothetical protein
LKLLLTALLAVARVTTARAEEPKTVTIPPTAMWSIRDPAMTPFRSMYPAPDPQAPEPPDLCGDIEKVLDPFSGKDRPKSAFIVIGSPKEALLRAHGVIADKMPMQMQFTTTEPLTLVFMSYSGFHMSLKPVELRLNQTNGSGNEIEVDYFVKMKGTGDMENYFALIPLGKLPEGTYQVIVKQVLGTREGLPDSFAPLVARATASPGFLFTVKEMR